MKNKYDPELLLAKARELREKAASADPIMRGVYRSLASEAEVRATLSLKTPIVKENVVPEDDEVDEGQETASEARFGGEMRSCLVSVPKLFESLESVSEPGLPGSNRL